MTAPNHIVGGYTFTGIFASILGYNILEDWTYLVVIGFAALLPDIDHTKSIIGKIFYPISVRINRRYGHRTITHSLVFLVFSSALLAAFQAALFPSFPAVQLYAIALSSHIIFDMMTIQGVPLFYPFIKNPCVLPGDPGMRIRTSDIRQEAIVMCVFIVSAVFLQPLFKNGFWTSYNRIFGTLEHLQSEFNKSEDLLEVSFLAQEGSVIDSISGYVIRVNSTSMTLFNHGRFTTYPKEGQRIFDIYPVHTGKSFAFEKHRFTGYTPSELNRILMQHSISHISVFGSEKFLLNLGSNVKEKREFEMSYINDVSIQEIKDVAPAPYTKNRTISKLKYQINDIKARHKVAMEKYDIDLKSYQSEEHEIMNLSDLVQKEIRMEDFAKVKPPVKPKLNLDKIRNLEARINELQHLDGVRQSEYLASFIPSPLKLSGTYETLIISDSNLASN